MFYVDFKNENGIPPQTEEEVLLIWWVMVSNKALIPASISAYLTQLGPTKKIWAHVQE